MAVGNTVDQWDDVQVLIETWDGDTWSVTPSPGINGGVDAVSCTSPTLCMAVGNVNSPASQTLIETWNGSTWSVTPSPSKGTYGNLLTGVSCASLNYCVAVGIQPLGTLIESWDGTSWSLNSSPSPGQSYDELSGVSCTSPTSCMAVGNTYVAPAMRTLALSWNGSTWSVTPSQNHGPGANSLGGGVSCTSPTACMAVGHYDDRSEVTQILAESWNGTAWSIVPSPKGTIETALYGVSCTNPTNCVAVANIGQDLIESWNGSAWSVTPSQGQLNDVSCPSPTNCVAVGVYNNGSGGQPLVETGSTPPPTITSFTPFSGAVGTKVTITGTNLSGATKVSFNGVTATTITRDTATTIKVLVPIGATTGTIKVKTSGGTVKSATNFTVA